MNSLRILSLAVTGSFVLTSASASPREQEQPPRFRAEVTTVLVDVLVLDDSGQPVAELTAEDFEIYEDDVLQQITNFDVIDWTSYVAQEAPLPGQPVPPSPTAEVNRFPRRFIFILNRQGARFRFMVEAKRALESFVVESMADGDEAMVIDMGMSTRVIQEFVPSKEETLRAIRKIPPMEQDRFFGSDLTTRNIYETLESVGQALGGVPGRKVLIFLSPELTRTESLVTYLEDTVDALNQSNTTVYSIDIDQTGPGVDAEAMYGVDSINDGLGLGGLFPLANETGGRYYTNLTSFEPAVRRIGEENRRYYLLSYTPTNEERDGTYRTIRVAVKKPGLEVVARKGYFALGGSGRAEGSVVAEGRREAPEQPPSPPSPAESPEQPIATPRALGPSAPAEVRITNYVFPSDGGKVEIPIAVAVPLALLRSAREPSPSRDLKLTISDGSGQTVRTFSETVDAENFSAVVRAALDPGSYLLQMTLEDSGEVLYQASTQIDVPAGFGRRFGLSSIVPILPPSASPGEVQSARIRPTASFRAGEKAYLFFLVLQGEGSEPSRTARVAYTLYHGERPPERRESPDPIQLGEDPESANPVVLTLSTDGWSPGLHRLEVEVADPRLGRRTRGEIELEILPQDAP